MVKRTVKLAFMAKKSVRNSAYRNRMTRMVRKFNELKASNGVKVCVIMYNPHAPNPEILTLKQVEQRRRLLDQERDLKKKIKEAKERSRKLKEENRVKELTIRLHEFMKTGIPHDLGVDELKELEDVLDMKIKELDKLIEAKKVETSKSQATTVVAPIVVDDGAVNKKKEPVDGNNGLEMLLDAIQMDEN